MYLELSEIAVKLVGSLERVTEVVYYRSQHTREESGLERISLLVFQST